MKMMMPDLPGVLVEEILFRVPATSLKRFRSTCKRWNDLFKDPKFIKKQFSKASATKQSMAVMLMNSRVHSMSINIQGIFDTSPEVTTKLITLKDPNYRSEELMICDIYYCDGLLLCIIVEEGHVNCKLVVWNPCLGQTRWIKQPRNCFTIWDSFAIGYDSNNKSWESYKILRIFNGRVTSRSKFEIYDSDRNSWRFLDEDVARDGWYKLKRSVTLNGNLYWIAYDDESEKGVPKLISFDFSIEKFRGHCVPPFQLSPDATNTIALSVVREEQLSLLNQSVDELKMDIWITNNKIDETKVLSWSQVLTVNLFTRDRLFTNFVSFFIMDEEKKSVVCYDKTAHSPYRASHYRAIIFEADMNVVRDTEVTLENGTALCCSFMFTYVPSLVQVSPAKRS